MLRGDVGELGREGRELARRAEALVEVGARPVACKRRRITSGRLSADAKDQIAARRSKVAAAWVRLGRRVMAGYTAVGARAATSTELQNTAYVLHLDTMASKKEDESTATETLTVRLTTVDRFALDRLVELRTSELAAEGIKVKAGTYVRGLVRREAMAKGLLDAAGQPTAALQLPARAVATPSAKKAREPEVGALRVALQGAIEAGTSQGEIARRAGIDGGHLSRFRREEGGLSPDKLRELAAVLAKL